MHEVKHPVEVEPQPAQLPAQRVTLRAIFIGALLIVPNVFWVVTVEGIWHKGHPTCISLAWGVVFNILILLLLNLLVKRFAPAKALTQAEFITIYGMLAVSMMLAAHDSLQLGMPSLGWYEYFKTPSNHWEDLFGDFVPKWLSVQDTHALKGYFQGGSSLYERGNLLPWVAPVLWWTAFIMALSSVMLGVVAFVRKQWTENEKLSYPIIELPMAMTREGGSKHFFTHRLLWIGIAIGAGIDLTNGLHAFLPWLPYITVRHDQLTIFQSANWPWSVLGAVPFPLYPFLIALSFFLPKDLSFSIWFFFLFKRVMLVSLAAFGSAGNPGNPYLNEQSFGAWFALFLVPFWIGRHYFAHTFRKALSGRIEPGDENEPITYRTSLLMIAGGFVFIVWFCLRAGMDLWAILIYFVAFFAIIVAITRVRAEAGPPAIEIAGGMNSAGLLVTAFGSERVGGNNLVMHAFFYWFSGRGYRTSPMPHQLEVFKMAERGGMNTRWLIPALLFAMFLGALGSYWANLHWAYKVGPNPMFDHNWGEWNELAGWMQSPRQANIPGLFVMLGAGLATFVMMWMRTRFLWWPFHPAGYALATNFGLEYFWSCTLIAWILKTLVLRYGGHKLYRDAMWIAFGIIIGEYFMGALWSALSVILGYHIYDFSPG